VTNLQSAMTPLRKSVFSAVATAAAAAAPNTPRTRNWQLQKFTAVLSTSSF